MKREWVIVGVLVAVAWLALSDREVSKRPTPAVVSAAVPVVAPRAPAEVPPPLSPPRELPPSIDLYSMPRLPYRAPAFRGYECTVDCSGHEAGYEWAERHSIDDPDDCNGNSESFIEGCKAYAEEQQEESGESMAGRGDENEDE